MNAHLFEQTTVESCLACCLLQLRYFSENKKITKKEEHQLLFDALALGKPDFVGNHLNIFFKQSRLKTIRYVHNNILFDWATRVEGNKIQQQEINLDFIDTLLQKGPLALVLDVFVLTQECHYPHWLVFYAKQDDHYVVYDPWEGREKKISLEVVKQGLHNFLNTLWMAPQVIQLQSK